MAENVQVAVQQKKLSVVSQVKNILAQENVKKRFQDVLGQKAPQFMASLVNVVNGTPALKQCDPNSIMAAAFVAASLDLPIDNNLGFAALVPYDKSMKDASGQWHKVKMCQFQLMYRGFVQLAIRSGEYAKMNCSEVYEDELIRYNPITGECEFIDDFSNCKQRMDGEYGKIIGYYAWFRLRSGFTKELYMSRNEIENHARKYSQAYRYDLQKDKQSSKWTTDFDAMAKKTVIKLLLSKWGILSVQMQQAIQDDQKMYDEDGNESYGDNQPDMDDAADPFVKALEDPAEDVEEIDITQ
ncbi:MAG: recombinase RecT [Lachnospiraceae bacterium]|nr:recombinase RecT [Lachnospiraceae bacterium]